MARLRRFQLQNQAARLLSHERVADCMRVLSKMAAAVEVQYVPATESAHYRGLDVCGSVWHCPICAAKISERRRDELARLVERHIAAGGSVYMTTYTIRHSRHDDLADLLCRFLAARRKMRQGRRGQALRRDFCLVGSVSVLEVTWSEENGWHPHVHELVFAAGELDADRYEAVARAAWEDAAAVLGLDMNEHGFELQRTYGAVADYIAKFGREPAAGAHTWGVESEVTKGHIKQGRSGEHYTPFALLAAVADGCELLAPKFVEYARVFKGRKQLTFSPGLKDRYQEEEKPDEELVEASDGNQAFTVLELEYGAWCQVIEANVRGSLLEAARGGRIGDCIEGLEELGIEGRLADLTGWRVITPGGLATVRLITKNCLKRWRCSVMLDDAGGGAAWQAYNLADVRIVDASPAAYEQAR